MNNEIERRPRMTKEQLQLITLGIQIACAIFCVIGLISILWLKYGGRG